MEDAEYEVQTPPEAALPVLTRQPEKSHTAGGHMKYIVIAVIALIVLAVIVAVIVSAVKKRATGAGETSDPYEETEEVDPDAIMERMKQMEESITSVTFSDTAPIFDADVGDFTTNPQLTTTARHDDPDAGRGAAAPKTTAQAQTTKSTYKPVTTSISQEPAQITAAQQAQIEAFFSKKFYMKAHLISDGDTNDMELAMNGDDLEARSEIDGKPVCILRLGGKMYIVNPQTKHYMSLSSTVMRMMGMKDDDLDLKLGDTNYDAAHPDAVTAADYGGEAAVCCEYRAEDGGFCRVILTGDTLREIGTFNADGTKTSTLQCDAFTTQIPSDKLTLDGYEKVSMIGFMSELM